jgi:hypothetical protein
MVLNNMHSLLISSPDPKGYKMREKKPVGTVPIPIEKLSTEAELIPQTHLHGWSLLAWYRHFMTS